jgi:MinD-like ATPase involved in chromosome partitioning or flagellar assembly
MAKIISIHSFRGGTGKSNTTANISAILAMQGLRVGVIDTDIQSPGIHVLFGFDEDTMKFSLNDYLWGKCKVEEAAYDVTGNLGSIATGRVYLIPSSIKAGEIAKVLREGYEVGLLNDGFRDLIETLKLDVLLIDTHPGLNEETLLSIAVSDALAIVMRPDQQDYQGTAVTVEVARKLNVPKMILIVNKASSKLDPVQVKAQVEKAYAAHVAAVMPHSEELMALASAGIFVTRYPDHPLTATYKTIAAELTAS